MQKLFKDAPKLMNPRNLKLPVLVACSSHVDESVIQRTIKAGILECYPAPVDASLVLEKLIPLMREKRQGLYQNPESNLESLRSKI